MRLGNADMGSGLVARQIYAKIIGFGSGYCSYLHICFYQQCYIYNLLWLMLLAVG